jgi:transmembrane sensor
MMTTDDIKTTAREWLLRLSLDSPTPEDRAEFASWCAEDPRHLQAYRRCEAIWRDVSSFEDLRHLAPVMKSATPVRRMMSVFGAPWRLGLVGGSIAIGALLLGLRFLVAPTHYATDTAEVREVRLPDGSVISLSAQTSVEIAMRPEQRRVVLLRGEAFFSVAKNPARPFFVVVGDKEIRVVGTQFDVRRDDFSVRVSVVEGTVEVMEAPSSRRAMMPESASQNTRLVGGQFVNADLAGSIQRPEHLMNSEPAAWRHGRLVYVDAPLREVVADANRYSRERIAIADAQIAELRVSVTYPVGRIDDMLAALEKSLPLQVDRAAPEEIRLKPRAAAE